MPYYVALKSFDRGKMLKLTSLCILLAFVHSCAHRQGSHIVIDQDATITIAGENRIPIKAGDKLEIKPGTAGLIEAEGRVPIYFIKSGATGTEVSINLRDLNEVTTARSSSPSNSDLYRVLEAYNEIQSSISAGRFVEAEGLIRSLRSEYPSFHYLKFIHASCLLLLGREQDAKRYLDEALEVYPDHVQGLQLKERLNRLGVN